MKKTSVLILCVFMMSVFLMGCECVNHQWGEEQIIKEATCTENGISRTYCTECEYYEDETLYSEGHDFEYESTIKKTTCTEDGIYIEKCTKCGETEENTIKAQHVFSERVCMNCGYVKPRTELSIGQTKSQVRREWGDPIDIDTYTSSLGTFETWWYKEKGRIVCVGFDEKGLVDSIQY